MTRKVFRTPSNLTGFLDEAKRHGLTALTASRNGALYLHRLTRGLSPEPVYSVKNTIMTNDGYGHYHFRPHIIPASKSFLDLPQCKASIDELVDMIKAARERQFVVTLGTTAEHQNFEVLIKYPHVTGEIEEYRRRLDQALGERAFADYGAN